MKRIKHSKKRVFLTVQELNEYKGGFIIIPYFLGVAAVKAGEWLERKINSMIQIN